MSARTISLSLVLVVVCTEASGEAPEHLHVPEGYTVETVAAPPLVGFPMMGGFDDQGRLYLAESAGLNLDAKQLAAQLPNFVRRIEDVDGDGRFDRGTIFADQMTYPMGALWHDGAVYVASPPYIWKLIDTDDDGVAETRQKLVGKFGYIGNAADIHGCFLGPTGRIYWCDGRHGHEFVDEQGQVHSSGKAARIFSCRPDGSDIEAHCGGGMDNPVEIDFSPSGEMLGTVNLMYQKRGDCLVQWMHGGVYPRDDQPQHLAEFRRTGGLMPEVFDFGHVAVSGMLRYQGQHLGPEHRDAVVVCEFNTHKLVELRLTRHGSTYRAQKFDLLTSTSIDFHPTDVIEDADGSLLVVDTGGWFRNGCPTSQVAKPEIQGGIYRLRREGGPHANDPRGQRLAWEDATTRQLVARLVDDRPWVVRRATAALARRGAAAVGELQAAIDPSRNASENARLQAVWTLARIDDTATHPAVRGALDDPSAEVRQAAAHVAGQTRDEQAAPRLTEMVTSDEPPVRREAATSLGKLKYSPAVPALLGALQAPVDRLLEHSLIYALIEINDPSSVVAGLADANSQVRRGALIALDQMQAPQLVRELVAPLLDTGDRALQQAAVDVMARRPGWAEDLIERLAEWLRDPALDDARQAMLRGALSAFRGEAAVQSLVATTLASPQAPASAQQLILDLLARGHLEPRPAAWNDPLRACFSARDSETRRRAAAAVGTSGATEFQGDLQRLADDVDQPLAVRFEAALALGKGQAHLSDEGWHILQSAVTSQDRPPLERRAAAAALASSQLDAARRRRLLALLAEAGPLEAPSLVSAFESSDAAADEALGLELVTALERSPGRAGIAPAALRQTLTRYGDRVLARSAKLVETETSDAARAAIDQLVAQSTSGDVARGKELFHGHRAACSACHAITGQGGQVGPDLGTIGQIRTPRDLAESILLPSLTLARGYETHQIATTRGQSHLGVIRQETPDALWLRTADRAELRIPRDEIEELAPSPLSIMPQGLDQVLTPAELADIVAYLGTLRP